MMKPVSSRGAALHGAWLRSLQGHSLSKHTGGRYYPTRFCRHRSRWVESSINQMKKYLGSSALFGNAPSLKQSRLEHLPSRGAHTFRVVDVTAGEH